MDKYVICSNSIVAADGTIRELLVFQMMDKIFQFRAVNKYLVPPGKFKFGYFFVTRRVLF